MRSSKQVAKAIGMSLAVVLCVILALAVEFNLYFTHTAYYYQDADVRRSLSGSLDTLICGSSHGLGGIMPTVLDQELGTSSYNLSYSMMTMYGRYSLLEKEIERNPVKTVFLEVSYNTITRNRDREGPEGDIYQLGRYETNGERAAFFISAFRSDEYWDVLLDLVDRSNHVWKDDPALMAIQQKERGFWANKNPEDLTVTTQMLNELYHTVSVNMTPDPENVEIFHQMMSLMQKNGIRVIMIVTPVSEMFLLEHDNLQYIMDWYQQQAEDYGCEYYDFNLVRDRGGNYPQDTAFFDPTHLSESGANTFSHQLAQVIRMADAGEDVSGLFYGSYAEAEEQIIARIKGA